MIKYVRKVAEVLTFTRRSDDHEVLYESLSYEK
jgi:hypothetical protein